MFFYSILQKFFSVRREEIVPFAYCACINFFLGLIYLLGGSLTNALFLKELGPEWLPLATTVAAVGTIVVFLIYGVGQQRFNVNQIFYLFAIGFGGLISLCGVVLLQSNQYKAIYFILFLINVAGGILLFTHFSNYLILIFDTLQSKRLLAPIFSAATLGTITGGFTLQPLLEKAENPVAVLFIWAFLPVFVCFLVWANRGNLTMRQCGQGETGFWLSIKENVGIVFDSRFIQITLIAYLCGDFALSGGNIIAQTIFAKDPRFANADDLASFYGQLEAWLAILAIFLQTLLIPFIIRKWGVRVLNFFLPLLVFASFSGLFFLPQLAFYLAMLCRFNQAAGAEYIEPTASNLLMNALSPEKKTRFLGLYGGLVEPLGPIGTGLLLTILVNYVSFSNLVLIFLCFGLMYFLLTTLQNRWYVAMLIELLAMDNFQRFQQAVGESQFVEPAVRQKLFDYLSGNDEKSAIFAAQLLARTPDELFISSIIKLLPTAVPNLKVAILKILPRTSQTFAMMRANLGDLLKSQTPAVVVATLRWLIGQPESKEVSDEISIQLKNPDLTIATWAALTLLTKDIEPNRKFEAQSFLESNMQSNQREKVLSILRILAKQTISFFSLMPILMNFINRQDIVAKQTAKILNSWLEKSKSEYNWKQLLAQLPSLGKNPIVEVRLFALSLRIELAFNTINLQFLLNLLNDNNSQVRKMAIHQISSRSLLSLQKIEALFTEKLTPQCFISLLQIELIISGKVDNDLLRLDRIKRLLNRAGRLQTHLTVFEQEKCTLESLFLAQTLIIDRQRVYMNAAIDEIYQFGGQAAMQAIARGLRSRKSRIQANALEALSNQKVKGLSNILSILEILITKIPCGEKQRLLHAVNENFSPPTLADVLHELIETGSSWEQAIARHAMRVCNFSQATTELPDEEKKERYTMETLVDIALKLKKVQVFENLAAEELQAIAAASQKKIIRPKELIIAEGDTSEALWVITSGHVNVIKGLGTDRQISLATLTPGEYFGEMNLFDGEPHSASVIAEDECELLTIDQSALTDILAQEPSIALEIIRIFSLRLRGANLIVEHTQTSAAK